MQEIILPSNALVALMALPGAGKSTFTKAHFAPDERVSSDFCRFLVAGDESAQWATESAFTILHTILLERLRHGRLSVSDATHLTVQGRREVLRVARRADVPPILIVLDVPEEVARAQNQMRERAVSEERMAQMSEGYQRALHLVRREPWAAILSVDPRRQLHISRGEPLDFRGLPFRRDVEAARAEPVPPHLPPPGGRAR